MLGLDVQFNIISYAVVSAKYESNSNILLSFLPLVENVLASVSASYISKKEVIDLFKETYGYDLPIAIFDEFFKILKKQNKIDYLKNDCIDIKKSKLQEFDIDSSYNNDIKALKAEYSLFHKKRGHEIKADDVLKNFLLFIIKNAVEFNSFIRYDSNFSNQINDDNGYQDELVEFLVEMRSEDTRVYKLLKDIYYGVVLTSLLSSGEDSIKKYSLSNNHNIENVLLDSNYIFRLLDLQTEFEHTVAEDTYNELKSCGCKFWVAKDTLKQIADTVKQFVNNYNDSSTVAINWIGEKKFTGLGSAYLRRGLSPSKLIGFLSNLEAMLQENYEVNILNENEFSSVVFSEDDKKELCSIKYDTPTEGIEHDLRLVEFVRNKRSKNVYDFKQAKWWVLTDDNRLTKWNSNKVGKTGIQECITESQLSTILWLNSPKNLSYDSLFSTVLALRNRALGDNSDFCKISKIIGELKDKYDDPKDLDKVSLVFANQFISIDEFINDDSESINQKFEEAMDKASIILKERDCFKQKNAELEALNEKITEEHNREYNEAMLSVRENKSLLSIETLEHIETLKKLLKQKEKDINTIEDGKKQYSLKINNQKKCVRVFCYILSIWILFEISGKLQIIFGGWYKENGLSFSIIRMFLSGIVVTTAKKCINKISDLIFRALVQLRVFPDYQSNIEQNLKQKQILENERTLIIEQIESKQRNG